MNGTSTYDRYNFNYSVSTATNSIEGSFQLSSDSGATDDLALEIGEAMRNHAWPSGTNFALTLTKDSFTVPQYQADFSATPPAFT